jgi:hypothetical protein
MSMEKVATIGASAWRGGLFGSGFTRVRDDKMLARRLRPGDVVLVYSEDCDECKALSADLAGAGGASADRGASRGARYAVAAEDCAHHDSEISWDALWKVLHSHGFPADGNSKHRVPFVTTLGEAALGRKACAALLGARARDAGAST